MSQQRSYIVFHTIILNLFFHLSLYSSIPLGTLVSTKTGMKPVEQLSKGDTVQSRNLSDGTSYFTSIREIIFHEQTLLVCIETNNDVIVVSADHQFYDISKHAYVAADTLQPGSALTTNDNHSCVCTSITKYAGHAICYELVLDEPHNFFITDKKILVHNFTPAILHAAPVAKWFAGAVIALLYVDRAPEIFRSIEEGVRRLSEKVEYFRANYNKPHNIGRPRYLSRQQVAGKLVNPCIGGIRPDLDIYEDILRRPCVHGPMCLTAKARGDGKIDCGLHVLSFHHTEYVGKNRSRPIFQWKLFGEDVLAHTHPLVKNFVKQENEKSFKIVRELVGRILFEYRTNFADFSIHAVNKHLLFDPVCSFYGSQFAAHALYCIAQRHIPIISILHTMNFGQSKQAKNAECVIFWDRKEKIAVLVEKGSKRVLSVGRYPTGMALLDEKAPETDEEKAKRETDEKIEKIKQGAKPGEDTSGPTEQYEKEGGFEEAKKDLEGTGAKIIRENPDIKVGVLSDGRKIVARDRARSSGKVPTLEIQVPNKPDRIKIRYGKQ